MYIDDNTRLLHMLDAAREAIELSSDKTRGDLDSDRMFSLAMVRLVEILCEAAYQVSQTKRHDLAHIDFDNIIGMRHRLVHGYHNIDDDILWETIQNDLPELVEQLEGVVSYENNKQPPLVKDEW